MTKKRLLLSLLFLLITGCGDNQSIRVSHNNLSDSYVDPLWLSINEGGWFPAGGTTGCSNGVSALGLATVYLENPPEFVLAEWVHLLTQKYYRAKVPLDERTAKLLRKPPFEDVSDATALIVQWRGTNRIAVMLVADFTDFSRGKLDVGEVVGEEIPVPKDHPNYDGTYETLRRKPGDNYFPGRVREYERQFDGVLTMEQRFGCPRKEDGTLDVNRLPHAKLPFLTGADGEYIPCDEYYCDDKTELINQLWSIGWRRYPPGSNPPEITFRDAVTPEPAY